MKDWLKKAKATYQRYFHFEFKHFLKFFAAFSIIFILLTAIILRTLTTGMYNTTDENLIRLQDEPAQLVQMALNDTGENASADSDDTDKQNGPRPAPAGQVGATTRIILYDKEGKTLNGIPDLVAAVIQGEVTLDTKSLGTIKSLSVKNPYGPDMQFRSLTFSVTFTDLKTNIAYIQILSSTNQLNDAMARARTIILTAMIVFWLLSIFVSMILARMMTKPILDALEKQKAFVSNASHELRTPLAILQNRLELLFQKPNDTIIDQSENISESLNEVRNMKFLTTNLLEFAKREDGLKPQYEQVNADFFDAIVENYQLLAESADKTFNKHNLVTGTVSVDRNLTKQLMTILFDNAMKYTGADGVIDMTIAKAGNQVLLTVADNGEGISDENKKKIFDRFYRVDKARTRQNGGFGLGLSLARQIVSACNGKIDVADNKPKGTIFTVRLKNGK
jgi:two-component system sensor histidine kinase CiaH